MIDARDLHGVIDVRDSIVDGRERRRRPLIVMLLRGVIVERLAGQCRLVVRN